MSLRLNLLGPPSCMLNDRELADLPAQKTRFALLIYLAVERNVSRENVATVFWGDIGDVRARRALSQSIYELTQMLGEAWLERPPGRLIISGTVETDLSLFLKAAEQKRLDDALQLCQGPILSGFFLPDCAPFDQWIENQRSHFERVHRRVRREHVAQLVAGNRYPEAIEAARLWVEIDPLEDEANHRYIELLFLAGLRTEALNHFAAFKKVLQDELNVAPMASMIEMVERLSVQEIKPREPIAPPPPSTAPGPKPPTEPRAAAKPPRHRRKRLWRNLAISAGSVVGMLALVIDFWSVISRGDFAWSTRVGDWLSPTLQLDTSQLVILPFEYDSSVLVQLDEENLLQDALSRWTGITVVDLFMVHDALAQTRKPVRPADAVRLARSLGAGRYIRGNVSLFRDTIRVHAVLYDANRKGRPIADRTIRIPPSMESIDVAFAKLADGLLFSNEASTKGMPLVISTRSWPARHALVDGLHAIQQWRLGRADSLFARAAEIDPDFAQAKLWLAVVRSWAGREVATWGYLAKQVAADSARLTGRDRNMARAMIAMSDGQLERACGVLRGLSKDNPHDFVAWYGLGDCLHRDSAVVSDPRSRSGWSFRTSRHESTNAFRRAFELMPSLHAAMRGDSYQQVRRLLFTGRNQLRFGRAVTPDTSSFSAYPMLVADTLAFIPIPVAQSVEPPDWVEPRMIDEAVRRQRRSFYEIARTWSTAFPSSSDAAEAVAIAMQMLGNAQAVDTLARARVLARGEQQRQRIAAAEVWLRIRLGIPYDTPQLGRGTALADSLLRIDDAARDRTVQSVAVLMGRPTRGLQGGDGSDQPEHGAGQRLVILAAIGAPPDSIHAAEAAFNHALAALPQAEASLARASWLERAAQLAWPRRLSAPDPATSSTRKAQLAITAGDKVTAARYTEHVLRNRRRVNPRDRTIDAVYVDAMLLRALGEPARAAAWLDSTLLELPLTAPEAFYDPVRAATLVRAMALRADLAAQLADSRGAARWSHIVSVLWNDCESPYRGLRARMRAYGNLALH